MFADSLKRTFQTPRLPTEIWLYVLQAATSLPIDFDTQLWRIVDQSGNFAEKVLHARLVTLRGVLRVCKLWHALATPLLYQTICIFNVSQLDQLVPTLLASKTRIAEGNSFATPSLDSYVERLVFTYSTPSKSDLLSLMTSLVSLCSPSLRAVHLLSPVNPGQDPYKATLIPQNLLPALPNETLQVLNLTCNRPDNAISQKEWSEILGGMVSLRTFRYDDASTVPLVPTTLFQLPSIERISIPLYIDPGPYTSNSSHSIKEVMLHERHLSDNVFHKAPGSVLEALRRIGQSVERVTLCAATSSDLNYALDKWAPCFPNATQIDLWTCNWSCLPVASRLPPSVTRLGLYAHRVDRTGNACGCLARFCEGLSMSRLGAVQLLGQQTCDILKTRHLDTLKRILESLRSKGIMLLDSEGDVITGDEDVRY